MLRHFTECTVCVQPDADQRLVSNAQLETVAYALQRFFGERLEDGSHAGFFLGDGAGVGKGRQIAAVIKEMWRRGTRRILWLSHNNDLREDARRDMTDMCELRSGLSTLCMRVCSI
jgi:P-loop containing NTP hydrolase pore-1